MPECGGFVAMVLPKVHRAWNMHPAAYHPALNPNEFTERVV